MLLRSSRAAGQLTKEALVGKALVGAGKGLLRQTGKHWKGVGGAGLIGMSVAPSMGQAKQKADLGLSQPWLEASNAGAVPNIPQ